SARRQRQKYSGKTYDSVESVEAFFRQRAARMGRGAKLNRHQGESPHKDSSLAQTAPADLLPGSYVRHSKYGRGLVLRREGTGDQTKLTVSFPGYGQKKLVEKYAGLQKDG